METASFEDLAQLKKTLQGVGKNHAATLAMYLSNDGKGFCHQLGDKTEASLASTSTCVTSLVTAGRWTEIGNEAQAETIVGWLSTKRQSSALHSNNPFTMGFVAEGILELCQQYADNSKLRSLRDFVLNDVSPRLTKQVMTGGPGALRQRGSISIAPYPPSGYLTQLAFRIIDRCNQRTAKLDDHIHRWSRGEINKQVALLGTKGQAADPLQLAYALILAVDTLPPAGSSPEDKEIFGYALSLFFSAQNEKGTWPLSRPMFHYPKIGSAYSFDYEALAQLLACKALRQELLGYIPNLALSARAFSSTEYDLLPANPRTAIAWSSGHHPQLKGPESWSTASVYQFAHALDRLVAEGIRRSLFDELDEIYTGPPKRVEVSSTDKERSNFAPKLLDAELAHPITGKRESLKNILATTFVYPIAREAHNVEDGGRLSKRTPMSAIFFGPPGTSKTDLAEIVSETIGWPLLKVDPSYLVKNGLDQIQAMANRLFSMLVEAEQLVVLLDEFDEMGRDRAGNDNMLSRFITTAMLPKLVAINKERKIVFILATNYISGFDAAFSRSGRFDMLLQVMPPTLDAKLGNPGWEILKLALDAAGAPEKALVEMEIGDLTYLETLELVESLKVIVNTAKDKAQQMRSAIKSAHKHATMERLNDSGFREGDRENEPMTPHALAEEAKGIRGTPQTSNAEGGDTPVFVPTSIEERLLRQKSTWKVTSEREASQIRLPAVPG